MKFSGFKFFFLAFLFFCLFSCVEKNNSENDVIVIDFDHSKEVKLSEIADSVSYIRLETNDECLIGNIHNIIYKNGIFYVFDLLDYTIYLFDQKGKYLNKLNKRGQGPGEYSYLKAFAIDEQGHIHTIDLGLKKIFEYNNQLEFVAETRIEDYPIDFYVTGDKYILYMPDENKGYRRGLFSLDRTNNEYTELTPVRENATDNARSLWNIINTKGNFYSVMNSYNYEFFFMEGDQIKENLHFHSKYFCHQDVPSFNRKYSLTLFLDSDHFMILLFAPPKDGAGKNVLFDKRTKQSFVIESFFNDIDDKLVGMPTQASCSNSVVFLLPGEVLDGEEENPILQIIHLKN